MQTSQQSRHHYQWTCGSEKFKWQLPWKLPKKASSSFISGLSRNSRKYLRYSVYHGSNRLSTSTAFGTQTDIETVGWHRIGQAATQANRPARRLSSTYLMVLAEAE